MITGIVVALPEEITTLTSVKLKPALKLGEIRTVSGEILICYSGAGPENAAAAAQKLLEQGAQQLLSWGCAAALIDSLKPGDLVLASELIAEDGAIYQSDSRWQQQIVDRFNHQLNISVENLAESSRLVASSEQKQALQQLTGAAIVDMESTAIAKVADQHELAFISIRTVADPVQMNLPDAVAVSLDSSGIVQLPKLLRHLLCHPNELPALIRLGQSFSAAKKTLCLVAQQLAIIVGFSSTEL